jgi:short-subunit dehydrogenase
MNERSTNEVRPLTGQVAVITGASKGIGSAISRSLAELGAFLALCGRDRASLDSVSMHIQKSWGQSRSDPLRRN